MKMIVTKDTLIGEILNADQTTAPYFLEMGMHCLGCPSSTGESLAEACLVHGVPVQELIDKLNNHISK
jgi:hybrid cluster-associated redox disulfide protein